MDRLTASVNSEFGLLLNTAGRHLQGPPPFRPPPPPSYQRLAYTISYPAPEAVTSQWPLATSSPPRSRHASQASPLTIAVQRAVSERNRSQEYSPQSQSSSSGFDSKNTSQQNQSSQCGSSAGPGSSWTLPLAAGRSCGRSPAAPAPPECHYVNWPPVKSVVTPALSLLDASVDVHYEFDATASPNETGHDPPPLSFLTSSSAIDVTDSTTTTATPPTTTFKPATLPRPNGDTIEARVQAMKQEFHEYRKRRARGLLESAC